MNYSKYDQLTTTPQEGITTARYPWKSMAVSISISGEEEMKNSGEAQLVNLLEAKIMQAEESMRWYLADQIHGRHGTNARTYAADSNTVDSVGGSAITASGKEFTSLDHIVRFGNGLVDTTATTAQSHTVGGITVTAALADVTGGGYADWVITTPPLAIASQTNWWWANYSIPGFERIKRNGTPGAVNSNAVLETAGEILGNSNQNLVSVMKHLYNTLSDGGEHPDLGLSGQEVFETYEGALMPLERFTDTKTGDAGFQNLRFKGMTLMMDHGITTTLATAAPTTAAPATPLYMLNSRYLSWTVDPRRDFATTPFFRPPDQDAKTAQILLMGNLTCSNRSKQGVIACANYANGYGTA